MVTRETMDLVDKVGIRPCKQHEKNFELWPFCEKYHKRHLNECGKVNLVATTMGS